MMRKILTLSLMMLAGCLTLLSSCKQKTNDKAGGDARVHTVPAGTPLKLAFVSNNANDFWKIAEAGVRQYEKETGIHVDFKMPSNGKVSEQKQIIENLLSQGYNGIAMSVIAPDDETAEIDAASRKTNFICHDSDAPKSKRLAFIGTNNRAAGLLLGKEVVKLLPNGGKMVVFVGTMSADNAQLRLAGVKDAVDAYNQGASEGHKIEIVDVKTDDTDHDKARVNAENVISDSFKPHIDLLCGLWAYNGPAMVSAVEGAKKKGQVKIVSFDEDDGTLDGIINGYVTCTVVQKPFQFGYQASKLMHELATKGESALPKDPIIDTGADVINKDNVAQFRAKLTEMKKALN